MTEPSWVAQRKTPCSKRNQCDATIGAPVDVITDNRTGIVAELRKASTVWIGQGPVSFSTFVMLNLSRVDCLFASHKVDQNSTSYHLMILISMSVFLMQSAEPCHLNSVCFIEGLAFLAGQDHSASSIRRYESVIRTER